MNITLEQHKNLNANNGFTGMVFSKSESVPKLVKKINIFVKINFIKTNMNFT